MALDSYEIKFFAWCNEGNHDKVWGFVEFKNAPEPPAGSKFSGFNRPPPGSLYNFWGRRGKHYGFKRHYGSSGLEELLKVARKKLHPPAGKDPYKRVAIEEIETVCPGFAEEFENQLLLAKFSNAVRSDDTENHSFI